MIKYGHVVGHILDLHLSTNIFTTCIVILDPVILEHVHIISISNILHQQTRGTDKQALEDTRNKKRK